MPRFLKLLLERKILCSPVAFQLFDEFTGRDPIGQISMALQEELGTDEWLDLSIDPVRSAAGIFSYPGLGYTADPSSEFRTHRILITSDHYGLREVRFVTRLYNHEHPLEPGDFAQNVDRIGLIPTTHYPYDSHIRRLQGRLTLEENGLPIRGAELRHQGRKVLSNGDGEFTLPVQFPAQDTRTTAPSELNSVKVQNARGFAKAVLSFGALPGKYRVFEIHWEDANSQTNYKAKLTLEPLPGSDDLPLGIPAITKVALISFALLIDRPPYSPAEPDQFFDLSPQGDFHKFHTIVLSSPN